MDTLLHKWRTTLAILIATPLALTLALVSGTSTAQAQDNSQWVQNFASSQDIEMTAMSLSAVGEVFIAGTFHGTVDFDPGVGETLLTSGASDTSFIAKYDSYGNFVWAYRLVGTGDIRINDIVVDPMAQVGVVGSFEGSTDLDPGPGLFPAESKGRNDVFLLRLLPDGNLQWAWTMGNDEDDMGLAITTNERSELYITGKFEGKIFFQGGGSPVYEWSSVGGTDVFVLRFSNAGFLHWVNVFGGDEDDAGTDIALDGAENVYVVGTFAGVADLDPKWTSTETRSHGRDDIFISMMTIVGASRWQMYMGGTGNESNAQILVKSDGSLYVSGEFQESADFDVRSDGGMLDSRGQRDIFLTHFGPSPAFNFEWATSVGGEQDESLAGIARDGFGNIYMLGSFGGTVDFDPHEATTELTSSGGTDIFLGKYSAQGNLRQVQGMSNAQDARARALTVGNDNTPLIAGEYGGTLDLGNGLSISTDQPDGVLNAFVAHFSRETWTPLPARSYLPGIIFPNVANQR